MDLDPNPRKNVVAKGVEVRVVLKPEGVTNVGQRVIGGTSKWKWTKTQIDEQHDETH